MLIRRDNVINKGLTLPEGFAYTSDLTASALYVLGLVVRWNTHKYYYFMYTNLTISHILGVREGVASSSMAAAR